MELSNLSDYQTSEKITVKMEIGSIVLRIVAAVIDFVVQSAAFILMYILFIVVIFGVISNAASDWDSGFSEVFFWVIGVIFLLLVLFILAYQLIFELIWKGQTIGKRVMKLRVVNDDGSSPTPLSIVLRNLFRIVDLLPVSYIVGFITMAINKQNKRVGDLVSGTIVIRDTMDKLPDSPVLSAPLIDLAGKEEMIRDAFPDKEKELFNEYLAAVFTLDKAVRLSVESKIINLIENRTGIAKPSKVTNMEFISAINKIF
ncbi:MAG: RDD family protein [Spirochaetales bacterium]|nr:RDD family protein [Spirochaetales bacterium]